MTTERQLTTDPIDKNLDNDENFSPDSKLLVFDCHGKTDIPKNTQVGLVDVKTGKVNLFYTQTPPACGTAAFSFLNNHEVVGIHSLLNGIPYDFTKRGGRIIPIDGSSKTRWLESRDVVPPFTPGALRGGTHRHQPDESGQWVGFTYNDDIVKFLGKSDVRNIGVSKRGQTVPVHDDPQGRNFTGESFSVLLSAAVDHPTPGSDEYGRAEGDCWVGRVGYPTPTGHQRARAFRAEMLTAEGAKCGDIFLVDVPDDLTVPGPLGPLEGTDTDYPKPPKGALVRRLTRTAANPDAALRGANGQLRSDPDGRWIVYTGPARTNGKVKTQVFVVSTLDGTIRQLSHLPQGVSGAVRWSSNGRYVAAISSDSAIYAWNTDAHHWGEAVELTPPDRVRSAGHLVIAPNSKLLAYNRSVDGYLQIFTVEAPKF